MLDEGRPPCAGVVAIGTFNLGDLGTKIGQCLADPRSGQYACQFNDFQTGQWWHEDPLQVLEKRLQPGYGTAKDKRMNVMRGFCQRNFA